MRIHGHGLTIDDVYRVAVHREKVEIDRDKLEEVRGTFERVQAWGEEKKPIYGVNTGFGELITILVPPQYKSELQENLLRSHAAGGGPLFSDEAVRAMLLCRINCLVRGVSCVSPAALLLYEEFLNRGIHPVIPEQGSLGASGDLAPLSHMALPIIGEGRVRVDGVIRPTAEVFAEQGLEPVKLGFKEALSLINGTSAMTGLASLVMKKAEKLLQLAILASSDFVQCLRGSTRAFDHSGHHWRNHSGQVVIAREVRKLLEGSGLVQHHHDLMKSMIEATGDSDEVVDTEIHLQHAYTLRCIPQILGPVWDSFGYCKRIIEEEVNSSNDNPLFFDDAAETFHGGNFHGQYVAMISDFLSIAIAEIGVLADRQVNRILDPYINGDLPPFLADGSSGLFCGFEGGQYLATSVASENLDIAAPSSIKTLPSNGSNQDVVSMGLIAARKADRLTDNVLTILTVLVASCNQASYFIGPEKFNGPAQLLHEKVAPLAPLYKDDTPLHESYDRVREYLASDEAWALLDELVSLSGD